jgi:uncharacterized protein
MIATSKSKTKKKSSNVASKSTSKPLKGVSNQKATSKSGSKKIAAKGKPVSRKVSKTVEISKKLTTAKPKLATAKSPKKTSGAKKPVATKVAPKHLAKPIQAKIGKVKEKAPVKTSIVASKSTAKPITAGKLAPAAKNAPQLGHKNLKPVVQPPKSIPLALAGTSKTAKSKKDAVAPPVPSGPPTNPRIVAKIKGLQQNRELRKDLAQPPTSKPVLLPHPRPTDQPRDPNKDRLILMVRDPFWLHAFWDITRKSVERAKASLAGNWHTAKPVLRLLRNEDNSTTSNSENVYKDIEIHGGVRHWYLEIEAPGSTFRLLLGYVYANNRFHELARSNPVTPPIPGSPDSTDDHWADLSKDADRVYALSGGHQDDSGSHELQQMMQDKLKKPIGNPSLTQFGSGAEGSLRRMKNFHLELDAEMVVFGNTHPSAVLTVGGEPVSVRSDGSYSTRVALPNSRQVLTVTSKSRDGLDEQTVVIAVERNTKVMEPLSSADPED